MYAGATAKSATSGERRLAIATGVPAERTIIAEDGMVVDL
jgi:hypothetical protein